MDHTREHALSLLLTLLALLLNSCAAVQVAPPEGAVYAMQPLTTAQIIHDCVAGAPGTRIFVGSNDLTMFVKPVADGWSFVAVDPAKVYDWPTFLSKLGGKGQIVSAKDMSDLTTRLSKLGWTKVAPSALPTSIKALAETLSSASVNMFSIIILPVIPEILPPGAMEITN